MLRLIGSIQSAASPRIAVKTYRDPESNEYRARLVIDGKVREAADYFTNDKEDALHTASDMFARAAKKYQ